MIDYIKQIRTGIEKDLSFLALASSLTLPDILGGIQTGKQASKESFINWYRENMIPIFPDLTAEECWDFRCKFLHQGQTTSRTENYYTHIAFSESKNISINVRSSKVGSNPGPKFIDVYKFVNSMCDCSLKWIEVNQCNEEIKFRINKCVKRHSEGYLPLMNVPVIY